MSLTRKTPLKRGAPPKRGSEVPRQSRKRRAVMVERRALVARLLAERPVCEGCSLTPVGKTPPRRSTDVHEKLRRSQGGSILDEANCLCLCRVCHDWVGQNPKAAVDLRLAEWRWMTKPNDS